MKKFQLFTSYKVGDIELKNRIVMAPMTRCRAIGNIPNDLMASYYQQRATAGLIITEGTSPSPNGLGYARIPGIFNEAQVIGWKKTTAAVHKSGGKIIVQLILQTFPEETTTILDITKEVQKYYLKVKNHLNKEKKLIYFLIKKQI